MIKNHLSRLVAPKSWPIKRRKGVKFITRPRAGPHKLREALPINIIIKDLLKHTSTSKETKAILNQGKILVDNKIVKDYKYPVGLMDIISIPSTNQYFIVLFGKNKKFVLNKISKEKANLKFCKIINKALLKKNKLQLNFSDGRNKITDNKEYKVGDTLVLSLDKKEIKNHLKLEKGASIYLIGGKHKGTIATLEEIQAARDNKSHKVKLKKGKENFETLKDYAFVIDKSLS